MLKNEKLASIDMKIIKYLEVNIANKSQIDLAQIVGVSGATISRHAHKLNKMGIIEITSYNPMSIILCTRTENRIYKETLKEIRILKNPHEYYIVLCRKCNELYMTPPESKRKSFTCKNKKCKSRIRINNQTKIYLAKSKKEADYIINKTKFDIKMYKKAKDLKKELKKRSLNNNFVPASELHT